MDIHPGYKFHPQGAGQPPEPKRTNKMKRGVKLFIIAMVIVAAVIVAAGISLGSRDTIKECSDRIVAEGMLNLADDGRTVEKNLNKFGECDGLSKADQTKAGEIATTRFMKEIFSNFGDD